MAYTQLTPTLRARGTYGVRAPFAVAEGVSYTCIAIRSFGDIYREGKNPYTTIYKPAGIVDGITLDDGSTFKFEDEEARGINIITLVDDRGNSIVLPDNYITSFPSESGITYREFYLSCTIGALPEETDTTVVVAAVKKTVSETLGIDVEVDVHTLASLSSPTYEQHLALEQARAAAIVLAPDTDALLAEKDATIAEINKVNASLIQLLADNGLLLDETTVTGE